MQLKNLLFLLSAFSVSISFGQHPFLDDGKLKGQVRKITQGHYSNAYGSGDLMICPDTYNSIRYFDKNKKELAKVDKLYLGNYFVFNYNKNNSLVEITQSSRFPNEEQENKSFYKTLIEKPDGTLDEKYLKLSDTSGFTRYEYFENGKIKTSWYYESFGNEISERFHYKYIKGIGTDTVKKFKPNSESYPDEILVYNTKGLLIYRDAGLGQRYWYEYYDSGKLKKYVSNDSENKFTENYDATGKLLSVTKEYKDRDTNPDQPVMKKEIVKITYEYNYDAFGNWIKKVKFIDGEADEMFTREIEYYQN